MNSIRLRLLKWLIGPILLINLAGASLTYLLAWMPAQLAFDQSLLDATGALAARLRANDAGNGVTITLDLPQPAEQVLRADDVDALYFVVRSGARTLAGDADFPPLRPGAGGGAYDGVVRGEAVRVSRRSVQVSGQEVQIAVAKTLRKRQQIRAAIVRALILLESLFTLALVGLIWFSVTTALRPLARMRANLNAREAGDLAPIDSAGVPDELTAVVGSFNELLDKVQSGAKAQHDFLADVAHQLRTPLAGVRLQLEWLGARHGADPDTVHSVQLMLLSNERMIRQTNQLLALARAEPSRFEKTRLESVDLAQLVAQTVQTFVEAAAKKQIDIGFDLQPAMLAGDRFLLRDLIDNLIDNAVRYTPARGSVTVRCRMNGARTVLQVEDSGPGIAPALRGRVFERYVRLDEKSAGNGLGLAIVRDVAQAHGASIVLASGEGAAGLLIEVTFLPVATAA